jgi:DNA-binding phage protein
MAVPREQTDDGLKEKYERRLRVLASEQLDADVGAAEVRAEMRKLIVEAHGYMRPSKIAAASGLTRQRIYQILQEERGDKGVM